MADDETKKRRAEKDRRYRERNGDAIRARKRASYAENKEAVQSRRKDVYAANIEEARSKQRAALVRRGSTLKEYRRAYYVANAERIRAQSREAKLRNPEAVLRANRKRRAVSRGAFSDLTQTDIDQIQAAQDGRCAFCRVRGRLTLDHIIPLARGGAHTRRNVQMLCRSCNARKGAKDPIDFARFEGRLL